MLEKTSESNSGVFCRAKLCWFREEILGLYRIVIGCVFLEGVAKKWIKNKVLLEL
jgi:hypothetical protein